jgi:hypothetical protein
MRPRRAPRGVGTQAPPSTMMRHRPPQLGAHARRIAPRCMAEADEIDEGAHNEDSLDDKAAASAARKAYAARAAFDDDKAATSAVEAGAYNEGSDGDKDGASATRRAYTASVAADDDNSDGRAHQPPLVA